MATKLIEIDVFAIERKLKEKGVNKCQASEELGFEKSWLSRVTTDRRTVLKNELVLLSMYFKCDTDDLILNKNTATNRAVKSEAKVDKDIRISVDEEDMKTIIELFKSYSIQDQVINIHKTICEMDDQLHTDACMINKSLMELNNTIRNLTNVYKEAWIHK